MTSILQKQSIGPTAGNWAGSVTFNQFNPADATPLDALLTLTGTVQATVSIENLAPTVATETFSSTAAITASAPAFGTLAVDPALSGSVTLPAFQGTFNGTVDFSSPSAQVLSNLSDARSALSFVPADIPGPSPIEGTGTFAVGVTSTGTSTISGGGNLAVEVNTVSGADVSLAYDTAQPAGGGGWPNDNGAGTWIFTGSPWGPSLNFHNLATTVAQVVTVAPVTSGSASSASFAQFNPALGKLEDIIVSSTGTLTGSFSAENLGAAPASIGASEAGGFSVLLPGSGQQVGVSFSGRYGYATGFALGGFDGTIDDAGTSGQTQGFTVSATPLVSFLYSAGTGIGASGAGTPIATPAALRTFTGTGSIAVPIATSGSVTITGPSSLYAVNTQQVGGSVTISYVYAPWVGSAPDAPVRPGAPPVKSGSPLVITGPLTQTPVWSTSAADGQQGPQPAAMGNGVSHITLGSLFGTSQLMFIGPSVASVNAGPNQTFAIGAGTAVTLNGFNPAAGDKLDLSGLLSGAPAGTNLANIVQFVSVNTVTSTVTISGPNGGASVSGVGTSLATLLADHALIVRA